jgi:hypothetical protein
MTFDLLSAVILTASAAVVIAILAVGFAADLRGRIGIAAALVSWFALVVMFGTTELFHEQRGLVGVRGLGLAVLAPVLVLSIVVLRTSSLRAALNRIPLSWLIGVNAVRVIGAEFVMLFALHRLPAPFAPIAGCGDILVGVTALPVAWLATNRAASSRPLLLLWNAVGLADLVTAVGLGVLSSPGPTQLIFAETDSAIMTTLPWLLIPGFLVPLLAVTHLAVFYRLRGDRIASGSRSNLLPTSG